MKATMNKNMTPMIALRRQKGFTLVEIAIVLVIIGLLLGGVLKGQQLITNSRIKATYNLSRELGAAYNGYLDRYRALPGDDPNANAHGFTLQGTTAINNGNTDGLIGSTAAIPAPGSTTTPFCVSGSTLEQCQALYQLRVSGFISGGDTTAPAHPFGGPTLLGRLDVFGIASWAAASAPGVCWGNLTNEVALAIDLAYDDGNASSGTIRGTANYAANVSATPQGIVAWTCSQL